MFVVLSVLTLPGERASERDRIVAQLNTAATALAGASSIWIAPVLERAAINAGHIVWRMEFNSEGEALAVRMQPAWRQHIAPLLAGVQMSQVGYRVTRSRVRSAGTGVWRALIFRVVPAGFPHAAADLEARLQLMPRYIPAIRNWALSTVSFVDGPKAFTHVWEQEFDELSGLMHDYMVHPLHWGVVDAWFDAESPSYIVDPLLVQVVGEIDRNIMT